MSVPDMDNLKKSLQELIQFSAKVSGVDVQNVNDYLQISSKFSLGNLAKFVAWTNMAQPDVAHEWINACDQHMEAIHAATSSSSSSSNQGPVDSSLQQDASLILDSTASHVEVKRTKQAPFYFDDTFIDTWIEIVFADLVKRARVDSEFNEKFQSAFSPSSASNSLIALSPSSSSQLTRYQSKAGQLVAPSSFSSHLQATEQTVATFLENKISSTAAQLPTEQIKATTSVLINTVKSIPQALSNTATAIESLKTIMILFNCLIFCLLCPLVIPKRDARRKKPFVSCDFPKVTVDAPTPAQIPDSWLLSWASPYRKQTALWSKWKLTVMKDQHFLIQVNSLSGLARLISVSLIPTGLSTIDSWFLQIITHVSTHGLNKTTVRWLIITYPLLFENKTLSEQLNIMNEIFYDKETQHPRSWNEFIGKVLTADEKQSDSKPSDPAKQLWWAVSKRVEYYKWAQEDAYDSQTAREESKEQKQSDALDEPQSSVHQSGRPSLEDDMQAEQEFADETTSRVRAEALATLLQILIPKVVGTQLVAYKFPSTFSGLTCFVLTRLRFNEVAKRFTSKKFFQTYFSTLHAQWVSFPQYIKNSYDALAVKLAQVIDAANEKCFNLWNLSNRVKLRIKQMVNSSHGNTFIDCDKLLKVCGDQFFNALPKLHQSILLKKYVPEEEYMKWFKDTKVKTASVKSSAKKARKPSVHRRKSRSPARTESDTESASESAGDQSQLNKTNKRKSVVVETGSDSESESKVKSKSKPKSNSNSKSKSKSESKPSSKRQKAAPQSKSKQSESESASESASKSSSESASESASESEIAAKPPIAANPPVNQEYHFEDEIVQEQPVGELPDLSDSPELVQEQPVDERMSSDIAPAAPSDISVFQPFIHYVSTLIQKAVRPYLLDRQEFFFHKFFEKLLSQSDSDEFPYHRTCYGYVNQARHDGQSYQLSPLPCDSTNGCNDPQHHSLYGVFINEVGSSQNYAAFYHPIGTSYSQDTSRFTMVMTRSEYHSMQILCDTIVRLPQCYVVGKQTSDCRNDLVMVCHPKSIAGQINWSTSGAFKLDSCNNEETWQKNRDVEESKVTQTYTLSDGRTKTVKKLAIPCDAMSVVAVQPSADTIVNQELSVFSNEAECQSHINQNAKYCSICAEKFTETTPKCCSLYLLFPKSHNCSSSSQQCTAFLANNPLYQSIFFHRSCAQKMSENKLFVATLISCLGKLLNDPQQRQLLQRLPEYQHYNNFMSPNQSSKEKAIKPLFSHDCSQQRQTVVQMLNADSYQWETSTWSFVDKQQMYTNIIKLLIDGNFTSKQPSPEESLAVKSDDKLVSATVMPVTADGACAYYSIDVLLGSNYGKVNQLPSAFSYRILHRTSADINGKDLPLESMHQAIAAMTLDLYPIHGLGVSERIKKILPFLHFSDFFYQPTALRASRSQSSTPAPLLYLLQSRYKELLTNTRIGQVKKVLGSSMASLLEFVQLVVCTDSQLRVVLVMGTVVDKSKEEASYGTFLVIDSVVISIFQNAFENFLVDMDQTYANVLLIPGNEEIVSMFNSSHHLENALVAWKKYSSSLFHGTDTSINSSHKRNARYECFVASVDVGDDDGDPGRSQLQSHDFFSLMSLNNHFDPVVFQFNQQNSIYSCAGDTFGSCCFSFGGETYTTLLDVSSYQGSRSILWSLAAEAVRRRQQSLYDTGVAGRARDLLFAQNLDKQLNQQGARRKVPPAPAQLVDAAAEQTCASTPPVHPQPAEAAAEQADLSEQLKNYQRFQYISVLHGGSGRCSDVLKLFDSEEKKMVTLKTFILNDNNKSTSEQQPHDETHCLTWLDAEWQKNVKSMVHSKSKELSIYSTDCNEQFNEALLSFRKGSIKESELSQFIWTFVRRFYLKATVPWCSSAQKTIIFDHYHIDVMKLMDICGYSTREHFRGFAVEIQNAEKQLTTSSALSKAVPFVETLNVVCTQMALCVFLLQRSFPGFVHNDLKTNNFFCNFAKANPHIMPDQYEQSSRNETISKLGNMTAMVLGDFGLSCFSKDNSQVVSISSINGGAAVFASPEAYIISKKGIPLYQYYDIYTLGVSIATVICTVEVIQSILNTNHQIAVSRVLKNQYTVTTHIVNSLNNFAIAKRIFGAERAKGLIDMLYVASDTSTYGNLKGKALQTQIHQTTMTTRSNGLRQFLGLSAD